MKKNEKHICNIIIILSLALVLYFDFVEAGAKVTHPSTETGPRILLLVDDYNILYRPGTYRRLHSLKRHPQPMIIAEKPWEKLIGYSSVHRDPKTGKCQMWYQGYGGAGGKVCYAESEDGINWIKPELNIHPYGNSKKNNIVLPGGSNSYGASVVYDPRDKDPSRRYKMAKWEMPKGYVAPWPGLYVAFSPDGIHWTRYSKPSSQKPIIHGSYDLSQMPLIHGSYGRKGKPPFANDPDYKSGSPLSIGDVIDVSYDPRNEKFMIYAKTGLDGPRGMGAWKRAVVRTDSKDFINWSKPLLVMAPDEFDGEFPAAYGGFRQGVQLHGGPTFFHHGVYFCLLQTLDFEETGEMPIELAISRDGFNWQRPFRDKYFLPVTQGRVFDRGSIKGQATPVLLEDEGEDEIRFYYSGREETWSSYAGGAI